MNIFILSVIIILGALNKAEGQAQQSNASFQPLPGTTFRWRLLGFDEEKKKYQVEMVFLNTTDSIFVFNYVIGTNRAEELLGRVTLRPRGQSMFGWLFSGNRITNIGATMVDIQAPPKKLQRSEPMQQ
ncbi:MAG: hypothetical protein HYR76_12105 [Ignavibacteria bacterium]|nr:hypothetical protein [Ignavibacteria bacterium]MBI3766172.1 hypothetical protein [Ignavibacteriales bacterium]